MSKSTIIPFKHMNGEPEVTPRSMREGLLQEHRRFRGRYITKKPTQQGWGLRKVVLCISLTNWQSGPVENMFFPAIIYSSDNFNHCPQSLEPPSSLKGSNCTALQPVYNGLQILILVYLWMCSTYRT